MAQHAPLPRCGVELPLHRSILGVKAVRIAVIGSDKDSLAGHHRRQPDRPAGDLRPAEASGGGVETVDLVVGRGAEVDRTSGRHRLENVIEVDAAQFEDVFDRFGLGIAPRRLGRVPRLEHPTLVKRQRDPLRGDSAAGRVATVRRPILGKRDRGTGHREEIRDQKKIRHRRAAIPPRPVCHGSCFLQWSDVVA